MFNKNNLIKSFWAVCASLSLGACATHQIDKSYIDDGEMPLSTRKVEKSEISFQLYREGAAGAAGGKSSGGCGCN
ncbi:MAG: DUF4266 domain-containing protein [Saprospiraceae bacterium]|jgi:hypothetical protein